MVKDMTEGAGWFEERDHPSEGEEDLPNVDADPSELMKREKPAPTLRFGPLLISAALIELYVERGYFPTGVCRPLKRRRHPAPKMGSAWYFMISLSLGSDFLLIRRFQKYCPGSR